MKGSYNLNPTSQKQKKGCLASLTNTELLLIIVTTGLLCYIIYSNVVQFADTMICEDSSCYELSVEIKQFMDSSANPCEDFHKFACGNFLKTAVMKQVASPMIQLHQEIENELIAMIVDPIYPEDSRPITTQKTFYRACMSTDTFKDKEILKLIEETEMWPLLLKNKWREKNFDWLNATIKCKNLGLPFQWFLEFGIHWEEKNYFKISYPTFTNNNHRRATNITNSMENILTYLINPKEKDYHFKKHVKDIYNFEQQLGKIILNQQAEVTIVTINDLQKKLPLIEWLPFLSKITGSSYELTEDTEIASNVEEYFRELYNLLNSSEKRVQANYIFWKILQYFAPYMSKRVRDYTDQPLSRSDFCLQQTLQEKFRFFTEVEYARKYFSRNIATSVQGLINAVKSEFIERIAEYTWLNSSAKESYLDKFSETEIHVAVEEEISDDDYVEANYLHLGNLTFGDDTSTIIQILTERYKWYYNSLFSGINETGIDPQQKNLLLTTKPGTNFHNRLNKLLLPLSTLRGFLYNDKYPKYLNFGSLGSLLAEGFVYAIQNLSEDDGVNITNIAFEASDKCFEDDYEENFQQEVVQVKDLIPGIIARDIAYTAYQKWAASNKEEKYLPLLPYTQNQLFWIRSSAINCYKKLESDDVDNEALAKFRNIFAGRHSRHFSDDFNCGYNTTMNPIKKC